MDEMMELLGRERKARNLARTFSPAAQQDITDALMDPESHDTVVELLNAPDPYSAVAEQANKDAIVTVHPRRGERVVFKGYGWKMGGRIRRAEEAVIKEVVSPSIEAVETVTELPNKEKAADMYLTLTAMEAFAPGSISDLTDEAAERTLGELGGFLKKLRKKIHKSKWLNKAFTWALPGSKTALRAVTEKGPLAKRIWGVVDPTGKQYFRQFYERPKEKAKAAVREQAAAFNPAAYEAEMRAAYGLPPAEAAPAEAAPAEAPAGGESGFVQYAPDGTPQLPPGAPAPAEAAQAPAETAPAPAPPEAAPKEEGGSILPVVGIAAAGLLAVHALS